MHIEAAVDCLYQSLVYDLVKFFQSADEHVVRRFEAIKRIDF